MTIFSSEDKPKIICMTCLVETSPQALPLGAACIASAIKNDSRTRDKFFVELLSFSKEEKSFSVDSIINKIFEKKEPLFVCMSMYVWNRNILEDVAAKIKEKNSNIICIAGGPEVTANPFSLTNFDYTCSGAGENSMPELINCLYENKNASIQGVYSKKDFQEYCKKYSVEQKKKAAEALRSVPPLPSEIASPYLDGTIDPAKYGGALWELARGCPFKCSYCYESKGENKISFFPEERLLKELELFAAKNIAQVFVLDPTYNADKARALKRLNAIKQKAPGMFFYFEARAEFIDRELAKAFASIPCSLQIGLQSSDENVLSLVHRTFNKKQFVKNIGILNEEGVVFGFDLIFGLPGDGLQGFKNSIDFAVSLYPNNIELFCLSVLPGTDLYERADELKLQYENVPPYHVIENSTFNKNDISKAEELALSCNLFYSQGRAVPWFIAVTKPLHIKPSNFFTDFISFAKIKNINLNNACAKLSSIEIESLQIDFIKFKYDEKHLQKLFIAAKDIIKLNNALSRTTADAAEQTVTLNYHPDDLLSEYMFDLNFFCANAKHFNCNVKTFIGKNGADYKIVK